MQEFVDLDSTRVHEVVASEFLICAKISIILSKDL